MRFRITGMILVFMLTVTACRSVGTTATSTPSSLLPTPSPILSANPAAGSTSGTDPTPTTSSLTYPPPGSVLAPAGTSSVILLDDKGQHKTIKAPYDPAIWQAGPVEKLNDTWSGQALTSVGLPGCSLRFSGGFGPDPSLQVESVSVQLNPSVTLYEVYKQANGNEALRLYRADSYDSAFAIKLDGMEAASRAKCVQQVEQVLASIVVQGVYP
jgi:hypothetical protein